MDKFPILWGSTTVGELEIQQEASLVWFRADCRKPQEGLWCVWIVGTRGELRLGVLEPEGECVSLRRRFSGRLTAPLGKILRGELRSAREKTCWEDHAEPAHLFHTPWLQLQLQGIKNARLRREGKRISLAIPYDRKKPFPLTALFCFAQVRQMEGALYVLFCFDEAEWPVFPEE